MESKEKCTKTTENPLIKIKEKTSQLIFVNKHKKLVKLVEVDGCQIDDDGVKCDFAACIEDKEYYIELKGQDIRHAIKQIKRTIQLLSEAPKHKPKICFVICNRVPLASAQIQNIQVAFKREFNSKLIVKRSPYRYII